MRLLLDTQTFIALAQTGTDELSARARKLIEDEDRELVLSAVSITEIAVKSSIKKLSIRAQDLSQAVQDLRLTMIPFAPRHALRMFDLPLHHKDPFDRMLIATALSEGMPIATRDTEFKSYRGLKVIS